MTTNRRTRSKKSSAKSTTPKTRRSKNNNLEAKTKETDKEIVELKTATQSFHDGNMSEEDLGQLAEKKVAQLTRQNPPVATYSNSQHDKAGRVNPEYLEKLSNLKTVISYYKVRLQEREESIDALESENEALRKRISIQKKILKRCEDSFGPQIDSLTEDSASEETFSDKLSLMFSSPSDDNLAAVNKRYRTK